MNMNVVRQIDKGSIVLVPRPQSGFCHAGEVVGEFELIDNPVWAEDYFKLRRKSELETEPETSHIGDIIQSWKVKKWEKIPFPGIPRWISYRLLSRNTVGIINDLENPALSAVETVREIMKRPGNQRYQVIGNGDIEYGLLNWISPSIFEHLVVDLLQLEAKDGVYWHHVGGCGDGGADGVAVDMQGNQVGILQCKWYINECPAELAQEIRNTCSPKAEIVIAALHGVRDSQKMPANSRLLGLKELASLVEKHACRLPFAKSIGLQTDRR